MSLPRPRLFLLLLLSLLPANAQNAIATFAGSDWTYPREPRRALDAPLGTIAGIVFAPNGDLLVADGDGCVIVRVTPAGVSSLVAGTAVCTFDGDGGPALAASFVSPAAIAADRAGNIWVADAVHRLDNTESTAAIALRKITPDGVINTVTRYGNNSWPALLAVDSAGTVYASDTRQVWRVSASGAVTLFAGSGTQCFSNCQPAENSSAVAAQELAHFGMACDPAGNLYLAAIGRLYKVTPAGILSTFAVETAGAMASDRNGNLYAVAGLTTVKRISPQGTFTLLAGGSSKLLYSGDGGLATTAGFAAPNALAVDDSGNVFLADDVRVRTFKAGGTIGVFAGNGQSHFGGDGGPARSAALSAPQFLASDAPGNLYFSEPAGRIRRISPTGTVSAFAGTGTLGYSGDFGLATSAAIGPVTAMTTDSTGVLVFADFIPGAGFGHIRRISGGVISTVNVPGLDVVSGLAFDRSGNLYIGQGTRNLVLRLSPAGALSTFAGTGQATFNGDNIPALQSNLSYPAGLAVDSSGNVYIAEWLGQRIRKVSTTGTIATIATAAQPYHVAVDSSGTVFFATQKTVFRADVGAAARVYAGTSLTGPFGGFSGDGGDATQAEIAVGGMALDAAGNLYIANSYRTLIHNNTLGNRIRVVYSAPPAWTATPSAISFHALAGSPASFSQKIALDGVPDMSVGAAASTANGGRWLRAQLLQGVLPAVLQVTADTAGLAPGTYRGSVLISGGGFPASRLIPVSLVVAPSASGSIAVSDSGIGLTTAKGAPPFQTPLVIRNRGGVSAAFLAIATGAAGWLSLPAASAGQISVLSGTDTTLTLTDNPTALPPGTYLGSVTITPADGAARIEVPVTLVVGGTGARLVPTQSALLFTSVPGGATTPPQSFGILNTGDVPAAFTVSIAVVSGSPAMLSATSTNTSVQVSVNAAGLAPGTYQGTVSIAPVGPGAARTVLVVLNVLRPTDPVAPLVRPAGLLFSGAAETDSPTDLPTQEVSVTNFSPRAIGFTAAHIPAGSGWFSVSPSQGSIAAGQTLKLVVQGRAAGLAPGIARGAMALQFDDGSSSTIDLAFVKPAPPGPPPSGASCSTTHLTGVFTGPSAGSLLVAGDPVTIGVRVLNDCGTPLSTGAVRIDLGAGAAPLALNRLSDGAWEATWTPSDSDVGSALLNLQAGAASSDLAALGSAAVQVLPRTAVPTPIVSPGGVGSAADLVSRRPVAPGGLIAIYGSGFAARPALAPSAPLPDTLAGLQVFLNGRALPLLFAGANQIDAVVPYDIPLDTPLPLYVVNGSLRSAEEPVVVAQAQPAVFVLSQIAPRQGAVVGPAGVASAGAPVRAGDRIVIYCEGLGPVNSDLAAGTAAPLDRLAATVNPVTVSIAGVDATVEFAGLAPGAVAEYQVNAVVPSGIPPGDAVPLTVQAAGYKSPAVTIAVR